MLTRKEIEEEFEFEDEQQAEQSDHISMQVLDYEEFMEELRLENIAKMYANIPGQESSYDEILKALKATNKYNEELYKKTDQLLDYNDEIVEIIELDEDLTMDISVAGDQLFYANGVLTKNSAGLVHTADFMIGVIETEELTSQGLQMVRQLKSRYGDKSINGRFNLSVSKKNQRWVEVEGDYNVEQASNKHAETKREKIDNLVLESALNF